ncbi:MAG: hypothetical protein L0Z62_07010 [Gemmataceae bacterium]|nr:hypothetical protein [Gemmataceae bacterium]
MTRAELEGYRQQLLALWRRIGQDRSQLSEEARQGTGVRPAAACPTCRPTWPTWAAARRRRS